MLVSLFSISYHWNTDILQPSDVNELSNEETEGLVQERLFPEMLEHAVFWVTKNTVAKYPLQFDGSKLPIDCFEANAYALVSMKTFTPSHKFTAFTKLLN